MSNLQIIEALCNLVELMLKIIQQLAAEIEQHRALTEAEKDLLAEMDGQFTAIIGSNEAPDFLSD
jgi:hypothetical protein